VLSLTTLASHHHCIHACLFMLCCTLTYLCWQGIATVGVVNCASVPSVRTCKAFGVHEFPRLLVRVAGLAQPQFSAAACLHLCLHRIVKLASVYQNCLWLYSEAVTGRQ
jgi:hypothetical protein